MSEKSQIRSISGRGSDIFTKLVQPLFHQSYQYDRVASYYSPNSLRILLKEFAHIWKQGGIIRLIIGFHERMEIIPALKNDVEIKNAIKIAVKEAIEGNSEDLSKLVEEDANLLPIIREMINQNALYVRLVTPKVNYNYYKENGKWPIPEVGTFHSKFSILHHLEDTESKRSFGQQIRSAFRRLNRFFYRPSSLKKKSEKYSILSGSMNESFMGYTENIEDVILHRSWFENEEPICSYFLDKFERMWMGEDDDVITMPFTGEFTEIITRIDKILKQDKFTWSDFSHIVKESPIYQAVSQPNVGLLPHQIRVFKEALSRWPIRVLLADEVGLGKTIEAGSLIYYLKKYCKIKRVLILTPASLRIQWQYELKRFFDLDFWVYHSTDKILASTEEDIKIKNNPLSYKGKFDDLIISWHWARLGANKQIRFNEDNLPDLVIVDEAHHARVKEDNNRMVETQLYSLLKEMQKSIPHVILLTATPFQTDILDYYSLMDILGVPDGFKESLNQFADIASGDIYRDLNIKVDQLKKIHYYLSRYKLEFNLEILKKLREIDPDSNTITYLNIIRAQNNELNNDDYITTHPASFLATRNYRSSLSEYGYDFPKAHYISPKIPINEKQLELFKDIEDYIQTMLGYPERSINSKNKIGLLRSLYRQRIVSSFQAAFDTLTNRKIKLNELLKHGKLVSLKTEESEEFSSDSNDENDAMPKLKLETKNDEALKSITEHARTEFYSIQNLLNRVSKVFMEKKVEDPKIAKLKELLDEHLAKKRKILVFSRFTSTTSSIINNIENYFNEYGVGRFDGQFVGKYRKKGSVIEVESRTRKEIVEDLKKGEINILVCSDAASEGLNLHYANVVINMDVPWNPSRLQQRFGRVDRLGQKAKEVFLINMFYPESIEERMYRVLEDRRIGFRTVLGEVPEIMSSQQKKVISDLADGLKPMINLTLAEVERERSHSLKSKLDMIKTLNTSGNNSFSIYSHFMKILQKSIKDREMNVKFIDEKTLSIEDSIISLDSLNENYVNICDNIFEKFEINQKIEEPTANIIIMEDDNKIPLILAIKEEDNIYPILSKNWSSIFSYCFKGEPIDLSTFRSFKNDCLDELLEFIREDEDWLWPDHNQITCLSNIVPKKYKIDVIRIGKDIGFINKK